MNNLFSMNISDYIEIMEEAIILGKERGKKEGDDLTQEFFEIAAKKNKLEKIKHLGQTEMDKGLIVGNLREEGLKILDLDEEKRRKENGLSK
jgi:predicted ATP-grasp superfamily ATP-dependent carboligase